MLEGYRMSPLASPQERKGHGILCESWNTPLFDLSQPPERYARAANTDL